MIDEKLVDKLNQKDKIIVDDMYGKGEALFARKFSDSNLSVLDLIDEMIDNHNNKAK